MKRYIRPLLCILLAITFFQRAAAQEPAYLFQVNSEIVQVYFNSDGLIDLDYTWLFTNAADSHPIDFVDVGGFSAQHAGAVTADLDGIPLEISGSEYQGKGVGFAVVLGENTIPPGGTGRVHVRISGAKKIYYPDTNDKTYASANFIPSYFGAQYISGATDLTIQFHLPPGLGAQEPRWHKAPSGFPAEPQTGFDEENRITYTWQNPNASAAKSYNFGMSIPRAALPASAIYVTPAKIPTTNKNFKLTPGILFGIGLIFVLGLPIIGSIAKNARKNSYLPPRISIEGHGIKRGLTAIEAAILMQQPFDKILTMILFGLIKKNAVRVLTRQPLTIEASQPQPEGLHGYEVNFLKAFSEEAGDFRQTHLKDMAASLVNEVTQKMRGFSHTETVSYYQNIMEKAWQQVESANTPTVQSLTFHENIEWAMLDRNYEPHARRVFQQPVILPAWWGNYDPAFAHASAPSSGAQPGFNPMPTTAAPVLQTDMSLPGADFAAQLVTSVQTFSAQTIGDLNSFTTRLAAITNPPPAQAANAGRSQAVRSANRSSGRRGGGSSCACACACAGCACACAGGGR